MNILGRLGIKPYGLCECSVIDCCQRVQDRKEYEKEKKPMCYSHSKMRDELFGSPTDYYSYPNTTWRYEPWDLEVG